MTEQTGALPILTDEQRAMIRRIAEKHGALHIRIFGSVARGEAGPGSDDALFPRSTCQRHL